MSLLELANGGGGVSLRVEDSSESAVSGGDLGKELDDFCEVGVGLGEVVLLHGGVSGAKGLIGGLNGRLIGRSRLRRCRGGRLGNRGGC